MKIPQQFTNQLTKTPETGMGYHVCTLTLRNGAVLPGVTIGNCEEIISRGGLLKHLNVEDIVDVKVIGAFEA